MLSQLRIENFALIEHLELELSAGFNVLTGETGAGKSIIIDAVSLLLGARGATEFVRSGAQKALVEGLFLLKEGSPAARELEELGYELEEQTLLLARELSVGGRNVCRIQGRTVPLNLYREIGRLLIDIHGQYDYQSLLRPENHLQLLDSLAGDVAELKEQVALAARKAEKTRKQLAKLLADDRDAARREDMLKYQLEEIGAARLEDDEEDALLQERQLLTNAEKLASLSSAAYAKLFTGVERQKSSLDLAGAALADLKALALIDPKLEPVLESLENAYYQMEDVSRELRGYQDQIIFDPARQNMVEERLALIKSLKRKYGNSIAEIKAYYAQAAAELDQLTRHEELADELAKNLAEQEQAYWRQAELLTAARKRIAAKMEKAIVRELADLQMPYTTFCVNFGKRAQVHEEGQDLVEFMFSPNPGEPVRPLVKIASGGELSRVILALKKILAETDPVPTLIFDEVDSGVGGESVRKVAEKLAQIGQTRQVLCVTHSPQVASLAQRHFFIAKEVTGGRTVTMVHDLTEEERVLELARMLGGSSVTELALRHAEEMLAAGQQKIQ